MMKRIVTIVISLISSNLVQAQFVEDNAIYVTSELNFGNYVGFDINMNYAYQEKYSLKIGVTGNFRKPKSQPEDYTSGVSGLFLVGLFNPYDQFVNYQLSFGRMYVLDRSGTVRANISIGIGYTTIIEPENWEKFEGALLSDNYTWNYSKYNTISLIINPKLELPLLYLYGLTVSPMLQISKNRTYVGIGLGQMLGLLREKRN
jgi:hypothetical protein